MPHDLAHDGQPQAQPGLPGAPRLLAAVETLEDPLPLGRRDPRTLIAHLQQGQAALRVRADGHRHRAALRRILDGVGEQVVQGELEQLGVADGFHRGGRDGADEDVLALGQWLHAVNGLLDQGRQPDRFPAHLDLAGFQPLHVQEALHHDGQPLRLAAHQFAQLPAARLVQRVAADHLAGALDGGDGRADLVAQPVNATAQPAAGGVGRQKTPPDRQVLERPAHQQRAPVGQRKGEGRRYPVPVAEQEVGRQVGDGCQQAQRQAQPESAESQQRRGYRQGDARHGGQARGLSQRLQEAAGHERAQEVGMDLHARHAAAGGGEGGEQPVRQPLRRQPQQHHPPGERFRRHLAHHHGAQAVAGEHALAAGVINQHRPLAFERRRNNVTADHQAAPVFQDRPVVAHPDAQGFHGQRPAPPPRGGLGQQNLAADTVQVRIGVHVSDGRRRRRQLGKRVHPARRLLPRPPPDVGQVGGQDDSLGTGFQRRRQRPVGLRVGGLRKQDVHADDAGTPAADARDGHGEQPAVQRQIAEPRQRLVVNGHDHHLAGALPVLAPQAKEPVGGILVHLPAIGGGAEHPCRQQTSGDQQGKNHHPGWAFAWVHRQPDRSPLCPVNKVSRRSSSRPAPPQRAGPRLSR